MNILSRFLGIVRPHIWSLAGGLLLTLCVTLLALPGPWIIKLIIDDALPKKDLRLLLVFVGLFAACAAVRAALAFLRNRILQHSSMRMVCDIRIGLFAHLQTLSLKYFDGNQTGRIVSRVTQDTGEVFSLANGYLINVITDLITLISVLGILFTIDWRLALVACIVLPFFALNFLYHRRHLKIESRAHRQNWDKVVGFLQERVAASRIIKAFARESKEVSEFASGIDADFTNYSRIVMRNTKLSVVAELLAGLGAVLVLGYGGWLVITDKLQVGTLIAFNTYIALIFQPLVRIVDLTSIFQRAATGLENVFNLFDTKPEVVDAPTARVLPPVRGEVDFQSVSFDYDATPPGKGRPRTLTDVTFHVPAGKMVAVVGPSGSGKSTLISLLARFYDPISGSILIDGLDIRHVTADSLRRQIGIVLQENVLFTGTIEDNLRYGRPEATREEIVAAAETANAHEFILKLPDGYSTVVGERGSRLSGGQRQRLAIARAILKQPRLLIFDEATSALDTVSEKLIQQAMDRLMDGRTSFVIAHRLSTVQRADIILVMDQGRLVEQGSHDELLVKNGLYARLHALQFQEMH